MTEHTGQSLRQAAGIGPPIYVACLLAYNNGCLHGRRIDADQGREVIQAEISAMLKA